MNKDLIDGESRPHMNEKAKIQMVAEINFVRACTLNDLKESEQEAAL